MFIANRITLNSVAHGFAVAARTVATFISIPILLANLGEGVFGLWMISVSLIGLVGFAQGGMAAALINLSANAKNVSELETQAASAFIINTLIFAAVIPIAGLIAWFVPWADLFNLNSEEVTNAEVSLLMFVLLVSLGVTFPASVPISMIMGRMKGFVAFAIDIVATITATATLIAAALTDQPLWILAIGYAFGRQLVTLTLGCAYLVFSMRVSISPLKKISRPTFQRHLKSGGLLTLSGFSHAAAVHSDLPIIGSLDGPSGAADYAVLQRLFLIPVTLSQLVSSALWPAFSRANSKGKKTWVARTFVLTTSVVLLISIAFSMTLFLTIDCVFGAWLGTAMETPALPLVSGMAIWSVIAVLVFSCDNLLKSLDKLKTLSSLHLAMASVNLPVSVFLVLEMGAAGAIWGTIIAYTICLILPYSVIIPKVIRLELIEGNRIKMQKNT